MPAAVMWIVDSIVRASAATMNYGPPQALKHCAERLAVIKDKLLWLKERG